MQRTDNITSRRFHFNWSHFTFACESSFVFLLYAVCRTHTNTQTTQTHKLVPSCVTRRCLLSVRVRRLGVRTMLAMVLVWRCHSARLRWVHVCDADGRVCVRLRRHLFIIFTYCEWDRMSDLTVAAATMWVWSSLLDEKCLHSSTMVFDTTQALCSHTIFLPIHDAVHEQRCACRCGACIGVRTSLRLC